MIDVTDVTTLNVPPLHISTLRKTQEGRKIIAGLGLRDSAYLERLERQEQRRHFKANGKPYSRAGKSSTGPFIGWDGEGETINGHHRYTLLANSYGHSLHNSNGIATIDALHFLCDETALGKPDPKGHSAYREIHVCYGASYDVNMMLQDLPQWTVVKLVTEGVVHYDCFRIAYQQHRSLQVSRYYGRHVTKNRDVTCTLWDVIGFFQCSFLSALELWLDTDKEVLAFIQEMKRKRGQFHQESQAEILRYCLKECELLVELMTTMRNKMRPVKLIPSRWDGAGAIGQKLLTNHHIKDHMQRTPDDVLYAIRSAYFGGRIQCVRYGNLENVSVYSHDIRSAYPAAMLGLPCMAHGEWKYSSSKTVPRDGAFRLTHLKWRTGDIEGMNPLPWRSSNGSVYFPCQTEGWYWQPEVELVLDHNCQVLGQVLWVQHCDHKPFAFVEDKYAERQRMRTAGHAAHIVLKLALNSIYGKLAQKVGYKVLPDGTVRLPTCHQLEWAGWITSYTRAALYKLALQHPNDVIAFETDGLYSTTRHECDEGEGLGQWEVAEHDGIMYLQSGLYWLLDDGKWWSKSRGLSRENKALTRDAVLRAWSDDRWDVPITEERFRTMATAVTSPERFMEWGQWIDDARVVNTIPNGKQVATPSDLEGAWKTPGLHKTISTGGRGPSTPHRLPWLDDTSEEYAEGERRAALERAWDEDAMEL